MYPGDLKAGLSVLRSWIYPGVQVSKFSWMMNSGKMKNDFRIMKVSNS